MISRKAVTILLILAVAAVPASVSFADDPEGWGDHPLVPRVTGSDLITYRFVEFDRVTMPFGALDSGEFDDSYTLEGEHTQLSYLLQNPEISTLQVKRAYVDGLEQSGFDIEFAGSGRDELGRRFHSVGFFDRDRPRGVSRSTMRRAGNRAERDKRFLAARHSEEDVYVTVLIHNNSDSEPLILVDVVEVPAEETALTMEAPQPAERQPVERDEIVAAHEAEDLTAEQIESGIIAEGRVAVRDILFEFDSAEIIDESADALATIAEVLEQNEELELLIVGHTDNVGDFEYNLNLSMQRARAVGNWLEEHHDIDGERLQAAGAGMMAPVATNRSEDGRAQNRRVELVEI